MMKLLVSLVLLVALAVAGAWIWAGRAAGPAIEIRQPAAFIGQSTSLDLMVEAPGGHFSRIDVAIEQNGRALPVFALGQPAGATRTNAPDSADRIYVMRPVGKSAIPQLQAGPARIVVRAARPVLFGLREAESTSIKEVQVRLEPPRVAVLSTKHYINLGGAEFVVYRATPADVESGVRVGDVTYPGFVASAAGIPGDASTRVAFFALLHDQDVKTQMTVYARDVAGNEATTPLDHESFPKPFARSRIEVDDRFLQRVVPDIVSSTPGLHLSTAPGDLARSFVAINRDIRQRNAETILGVAKKTAPELLWRDAFAQLGNSKVESRFADRRTYFYQGKEIDQQTHLGFDLAVTANIPVAAAQRGTVALAQYLGIYGNCVIIDHGLGVQSLYGHLSAIDVSVGAHLDKGQIIGKSGMTGLAGGDHLHFTMLVEGHPVNPVEWWDAKWMQDRVLRKIAEAGGA